MPNVNLTLPTLPTPDQKDAMDNANAPNGSNVFVTLNDLPATPGLATVLGVSKSTGGNAIESPDGNSTANILNGSAGIRYALGAVDGYAYFDVSGGQFHWTNGTKTGGITADATKTEISHTDLINLSATSVTKNGSEIATEAFAQSLTVGLLDDRGNFDASVNLYPSSGGSGTAGAILRGDIWTVSIGGTMGTQVVTAGDLVRALVDTPGQTNSNWAVTENNIGYVAENANNKSTSVAGDSASNTKYPSVKAVFDWVTGLGYLLASTASSTYQIILTDSVFGTLLFGFTSKTTPVDADSWSISDSADSNKAKRVTGTNFKAYLKSYFDGIYTTTSAVATQITTALSTFKTANFLDATSSIQTQLNTKIFTMQGAGTSGVVSPFDATTYYAGTGIGAALNSSANLMRVYPPVACTLTGVIVNYRVGTPGSNETSTVYARFNNTTDITISSAVTTDANFQAFSNTGLNQAFNGTTDYFEIKWTTPTWATNPTGLIMSFIATFKQP